jgi:hypothetical protein
MELKNSIILFLLLINSCGPDVRLVPESPHIYRECDKLCKKKYGEDVSVFSAQKSISNHEFDCYCK